MSLITKWYENFMKTKRRFNWNPKGRNKHQNWSGLKQNDLVTSIDKQKKKVDKSMKNILCLGNQWIFVCLQEEKRWKRKEEKWWWWKERERGERKQKWGSATVRVRDHLHKYSLRGVLRDISCWCLNSGANLWDYVLWPIMSCFCR